MSEFEYFVCKKSSIGLVPVTGVHCNADGLTEEQVGRIQITEQSLRARGMDTIAKIMREDAFPATFAPAEKPEGKLSEEQCQIVRDIYCHLGCSPYSAVQDARDTLTKIYPDAFPEVFGDEDGVYQGPNEEDIPAKVVRWERTGEYRVPKKGEWFECNTPTNEPLSQYIEDSMVGKRWILRKVVGDGE